MRQRQTIREADAKLQLGMLAAIRADLHNTAAGGFGRMFNREFTVEEFMGGVVEGIEERAAKLIEQGYTPSEAAAIASSKQSRRGQVAIIDKALNAAQAAKARGRGRRRA